VADVLLCRLLAYLPEAGFAADPVGVLAVRGTDVAFELVPADEAEGWARRLAAAVVDADAVRSWERRANGMSWAIRVTEVPAADSLDGMRALVSAAFEELLVERALVREEIP
jgi:hypothetical protein